MKIVVVTGMSGSGKTVSLKLLEDLDYYCVDNMPVELTENLIKRFLAIETGMKKLALGIDIRCGEGLFCLLSLIDKLRDEGIKVELLFLDASNECLIKRYKESRRKHPLLNKDTHNIIKESVPEIDDAYNMSKLIDVERKLLLEIKAGADYIIDTGDKLIRNLKEELSSLFGNDDSKFNIRLYSFGYMYGLPQDSDLVFDVRFLPNPFYNTDLKNRTGEDKEVSDFAINNKDGKEFISKINDLLKFLIPKYINEGKSGLVISIGCTGGKHRSVAVARKIFDSLSENNEVYIKLIHRDKEKN